MPPSRSNESATPEDAQPPRGPRAQVTGERTLRESKSALLDAAQAAVKDQQTRPRPRERQPATGGVLAFRLLLGILTIAAGALLVIQPEWLAGPKLPADNPAVQQAAATMVLIEAASQIRAYQSVTGRLPEQLEDAGVANPAVSYQKVDTAKFVISMPAADSTIVLRSTDSIRPLALRAIQILQRRS